MKRSLPFEKASSWFLLAFAATAVFSIVWQHLIWVAVALWLIAWAKGRVKPEWPMGSLGVMTLVFLATFFTGALFGVDPSKSFTTVHKNLTFLVFFLVGAMDLGFPFIKKLLLFYTHGAAFCGLLGILKHFIFGGKRISSVFGGYIMIFGGLLMIALLIQLFFLLKNPRNRLHWAVTLVLGLALLLNQTRGAWIGLVAGLFLMLWFFRKKWIVPALLLIVVGFFLLPHKYQNRVKSIWNPGSFQKRELVEQDPSVRHTNHERLMMWKAGWAISKDYPLFGIGHDNLSQVYPRYMDPEAREKNIPHLHNNFVQILAQNGWLGLLCYLLWIGAYGFASFRKRRWLEEARDWNLVLTCVFGAGLVWGLTEYTFTHQFMNVQFFLMGLQANLWKTSRKK